MNSPKLTVVTICIILIIIIRRPEAVQNIAYKGRLNFDVIFPPLSSGLKPRSNVISYVTVNDSPDSDSSSSSPYPTDTLSALRGNSGALLEGPGRVVADGTGTRTIIVPPLKAQLGDCTVATQASGKCTFISTASIYL